LQGRIKGGGGGVSRGRSAGALSRTKIKGAQTILS